jgi:cytoskeletal protein RodZ
MITAVAVIIAAVILAVTSADRTHLANSQSSSNTGAPATRATTTPTSSHPTSSAPASSSSTVARTSTTVASSTTAPTAGQKAKNLLVTPGVESSLVRSWLATDPGGVGLSPKDVAGTQPGLVYYAEQPASATYWALVVFKPSATLMAESSTAAGLAKLAEFRNSTYAFSWQSGPVWTLLGEVGTGSCPGVVPAPVLKVWGMCGL